MSTQTADTLSETVRRVTTLVEHHHRDAPFRAPETQPEWQARLLNSVHDVLQAARGEAAGFTILWARSDRYKRPTVVAAWSEGYVDAYSDAYRQERDEKIRWFRDFGDPSDGPWTFWTTQEDLPITCEHAFQHHPESEDVGVCSHCGAEEIDA